MTAGVLAHGADQLGSVTHHITGQPPITWIMNSHCLVHTDQIDYIMVRSKDRYMVQNSRSYNGITTNTDHTLVIANLKLEWWKKQPNSKSEPRINISKLNDLNIREKYQIEVTKIYDEVKDFKDNQEQWTHLVSSCHQAGKEILGEVPRSVKHQEKTLEELSKKQRKTKEDIEKCQSKETRSELRKDRNNTMKLIRKRIQVIEDQELNHKLEEIEKHKDDSRRCFIAIKELNRKKEKKTSHCLYPRWLSRRIWRRTSEIYNSTFHQDVHKRSQRKHWSHTTI